MALNIDLQRFAAYFVVGYGAEIQYLNPYALGNAGGGSGWSLGRNKRYRSRILFNELR